MRHDLSTTLRERGATSVLSITDLDPALFGWIGATHVELFVRVLDVLAGDYTHEDAIAGALEAGERSAALRLSAGVGAALSAPLRQALDEAWSAWVVEISADVEQALEVALDGRAWGADIDDEVQECARSLRRFAPPERRPDEKAEVERWIRVFAETVRSVQDLAVYAELVGEEMADSFFDDASEAWGRLIEILRVGEPAAEVKAASELLGYLPTLVLRKDAQLVDSIASGDPLSYVLSAMAGTILRTRELGDAGSRADYRLSVVGESRLGATSQVLLQAVSKGDSGAVGPAELDALERRTAMSGSRREASRLWLGAAKATREPALRQHLLGRGLLEEGLAAAERDERPAAQYLEDAIGCLLSDPENMARAASGLIAVNAWSRFRTLVSPDANASITQWLDSPSRMLEALDQAELMSTIGMLWIRLEHDDVAAAVLHAATAQTLSFASVYSVIPGVVLIPSRLRQYPDRVFRRLLTLVGPLPGREALEVTFGELADELAAFFETGTGTHEVREAAAELLREFSNFDDPTGNFPAGLIAAELEDVVQLVLGGEGYESPKLTAEVQLSKIYPEWKRRDLRIPVVVSNSEKAAPAPDVVATLSLDANSPGSLAETHQQVGELRPGESREVSFWLSLSRSQAFDFTKEGDELKGKLEFGVGDDRSRLSFSAALRPAPPQTPGTPYATGDPVEGTHFVGRESLLKEIRGALAGSERDRPVLVHGIRRIGKTSLMKRVVEHPDVSRNNLVVFFDAEARPKDDTSCRFLKALVKTILQELPTQYASKIDFRGSDFDEDPYASFDLFVRAVPKSGMRQRLLLVIDEFDHLVSLADATEQRREAGEAVTPQTGFEVSVFAALRAAVMVNNEVNLMIGGMPSLRETAYEDRLFGMFVEFRVGPFTTEEALQVVALGTQRFTLTPAAQEYLLAAAGRQPYLLQLVCHYLYGYMQGEARDLATLEDVRKVIKKDVLAKDYVTSYRNLVQDELGEQAGLGEEVLLGIAAAIEKVSYRRSYVSIREVIGALRERGVDRSEEQVGQIVDKLAAARRNERPLIERAKNHSNRVRLVIGMLGDFLLQGRS